MQSQRSSVSFLGKQYRLYGRYYRAQKGEPSQYLHRAIWESNYGPIPKGFHVHHKDGNPLNNAIENLEAIDGREHNREHGLTAPHLRSHERRELLNRIRPQSHAWLKDPNSRKHLSEKIKEVWRNKPVRECTCGLCGEKFMSTATRAMYCSRKCQRAETYLKGLDELSRDHAVFVPRDDANPTLSEVIAAVNRELKKPVTKLRAEEIARFYGSLNKYKHSVFRAIPIEGGWTVEQEVRRFINV